MTKEKVIHARLSKELYEKISGKSKKHRLTVSQLLRNLVEDYLEVSGDVIDIVDNKIKELLEKEDEEILGFENVTLNKSTSCILCGRNLKKGDDANLAFFERTHHKAVVCQDCRKEKES